jgi:hypothetical protein
MLGSSVADLGKPLPYCDLLLGSSTWLGKALTLTKDLRGVWPQCLSQNFKGRCDPLLFTPMIEFCYPLPSNFNVK